MYDHLYGTNPRKSWFTTISPECRTWLEGLADHIIENGEPVWASVHRHLKEHFPDDAPVGHTTPVDAVRRLVAERQASSGV